jgi:hypothetical protein
VTSPTHPPAVDKDQKQADVWNPLNLNHNAAATAQPCTAATCGFSIHLLCFMVTSYGCCGGSHTDVASVTPPSPGDFEGDAHDDVSELGAEACNGLVGWLDFYHKVNPWQRLLLCLQPYSDHPAQFTWVQGVRRGLTWCTVLSQCVPPAANQQCIVCFGRCAGCRHILG